MSLFKNLFGGNAKAKKKAEAKSADARSKSKPGNDSARAKLIAEALRIQSTQGAVVRKTLSKAIGDLGNSGPKILRDQDALTRLVELIQTRQTLNGLAAEAPKAEAGSPKTRGTRH